MRNPIRVALASTALLAGVAVAGASPANAQVSFQGSFPLPHGSVSIAIGDPAFAVGAYVPTGYAVAPLPGYGDGFAYRDRWIPVRPYAPRWVVCARPYLGGGPYFRRAYAAPVYARPYGFRVRHVDHGHRWH
jgi:hypothetical protein